MTTDDHPAEPHNTDADRPEDPGPCWKCGYPIPPGETICPECGSRTYANQAVPEDPTGCLGPSRYVLAFLALQAAVIGVVVYLLVGVGGSMWQRVPYILATVVVTAAIGAIILVGVLIGRSKD